MTTPSEPLPPALDDAPGALPVAIADPALGAGRERRLHPLSWLFVLLAQLREFALPLIAVLFFGRGGGAFWEWLGLLGAGALSLSAVLRYYTYRFRIGEGELVIRSGLLQRNLRHVPLARIQNVVLRRNPLHRLFGVAEVKLESAVGGGEAEAQMRVLSLHDAQALESLVRAQAGAAPTPARAAADRAAANVDAAVEEPAPHGDTLLSLPLAELLKLGLGSQRGTLLAAAFAGAVTQFLPGDVGFNFRAELAGWTRAVFGYVRDLHLDWLAGLASALGLLLAVLLLLRLLSVAMVLLQHYGFQLQQRGDRLSVEAGLLTRVRSHAALRKIQHWTLRDNPVLRRFGRRSLRVESAALQVGQREHSLADLVPIAPPAQIDGLLRQWLPWWSPSALDWQPLHPRAWRRMLWPPLLGHLGVCLLLGLKFGAVAALGLLLLPGWVWLVRRQAALAFWAVDAHALYWRSGWWARQCSFAEIGKLQGLRLSQSPFDRRHGMASVLADTAGANPLGHRLQLHYLPEAAARALYRRLARQMAAGRLAW